MNKKHYVANCVNAFDEDGNCNFDFFIDSTDFAQKLEEIEDYAVEGGEPYLDEDDFLTLVDVPFPINKKTKGHEIQYFYLDIVDGGQLFVLYDMDDDIHYFFE